ncbi:MAG: DivIVA domain-containing protein [candidate division Zixibacteria bacterium]|nr:DivIVA domain-containing protein [candidate division Zixibacteria bacterium]
MKITSWEVKNQKFRKKFKGYDPVEVESFLEILALEIEEGTKEVNLLKEKVSSLENKLSEYKNMELTLQNVILTTQKTAEELKRNAEKEAELLIREAYLKREKLLEESNFKMTELKRGISELKSIRDGYLLKFRSILELHKNLLEGLEKDETYTRVEKRKELTEEEMEKVINQFEKESPQKGETS